MQYHWPGNVRELRNTMDQAAVFAQGETVAGHEIDFVPARIDAFRGRELGNVPASAVIVAGARVEPRVLLQTRKAVSGGKQRMAPIVGIG